jgi:spectinomycin phosphotransferase
MLEKPILSDEQIIACLYDTYGIRASDIEFLPLGYDFHAGVYRVQDDTGQDYFLKARQDAVYEPGIHIARTLKAQGIRQVVAPLPTISGELWGKAGDYALLLYPFIEGQSGMEAGLTDAQWVEYGDVLRRIHAVRLPDELARTLRSETYIPYERWMDSLKALHAQVRQREYDELLQQQIATFWRERYAEIGQIIERAETLSRRLQSQTWDFVLCHADIHTNNLLLTVQGELYVVDWDQPMFAPKERDLMFIMDRGIGFGPDERQEALFFQGYGPVTVNPLALAYYRYEWLAQDLGSFAEMVFAQEDAGEETRQDSARLFMAQFEAGNLAEIAHRLDAVVFRTV